MPILGKTDVIYAREIGRASEARPISAENGAGPCAFIKGSGSGKGIHAGRCRQQGSRKLFINHCGVYPVVDFNGHAAGTLRESPSRIAVSGATHRGDRIVSAETLFNARADFNALLSLSWRNRGSRLEAAERKSVGVRYGFLSRRFDPLAISSRKRGMTTVSEIDADRFGVSPGGSLGGEKLAWRRRVGGRARRKFSSSRRVMYYASSVRPVSREPRI